MLVVTSLRKRFGKITAVDEVSFTVAQGEAFGLLGPNGAGKTTTIHMLVGALDPDSGSVEIEGAGAPSEPKARSMIGVAPQALAVYNELTGEENLKFAARLYGLGGARLKERVAWALELAGLTDRRRHRAGTYSGGMKRRLNLASALLHQPSVVLMDEPTVGVDPQSRNHIFDCIEQLKAEGVTILYTTHYMEEAQRLCDRVAIMDRGRVLALNTVDGLLHEHGGESVIEASLETIPEDPSTLPGRLDGADLRIQTDDPLQLVGTLSDQGVRFRTLSVHRPDLETVFLSLTGRSLRDE